MAKQKSIKFLGLVSVALCLELVVAPSLLTKVQAQTQSDSRNQTQRISAIARVTFDPTRRHRRGSIAQRWMLASGDKYRRMYRPVDARNERRVNHHRASDVLCIRCRQRGKRAIFQPER